MPRRAGPPNLGGRCFSSAGGKWFAAGRLARGVKTQSGIPRSGLARPWPDRRYLPAERNHLQYEARRPWQSGTAFGCRVEMAFARYSMERTRDRQIECRAGGAVFRRPRTVLAVQCAIGDTPPIATEAVIRLDGALLVLRHEAGSPQLPWSAATDCAPPLPIAARLVRPRSSDCAARPVVFRLRALHGGGALPIAPRNLGGPPLPIGGQDWCGAALPIAAQDWWSSGPSAFQR